MAEKKTEKKIEEIFVHILLEIEVYPRLEMYQYASKLMKIIYDNEKITDGKYEILRQNIQHIIFFEDINVSKWNKGKLGEKIFPIHINEFFVKHFKNGIKYYTERYNFVFNEKPNMENLPEGYRIPSNDKYPNFFQSIYHAGDDDQFNKVLDTIADLKIETREKIIKTYEYMSRVFKKGVFVYINGGKLQVYLPFCYANYKNDWEFSTLQIEKYGKISGNGADVIQLAISTYRSYDKGKYATEICTDSTKWYANYCIFRNTVYKNGKLKGLFDEGDKSIENFKNLVEITCKERSIKNIFFFINPRDFPILRKDFNHPYDRLYSSPKYLGDEYRITAPIFSQSTSSVYADILLPTDDDIEGLESQSYFTEWKFKKNIAVFRGSATGCGVTPNTNKRLGLYELGKNNKLMNVRLTGLNRKPKLGSDRVVRIIDTKNYPEMFSKDKKSSFLSSEEQSKFKYIIHVEGHTAAFRLRKELSYGSVLLIVQSDWRVWYSDFLIRYDFLESNENVAHYISILPDMSDLNEKIKWCIANDHICEKIGSNCFNLWKTKLNKDGILDYFSGSLNGIDLNNYKDEKPYYIS